jgi:CheY-like chemotaxis protein
VLSAATATEALEQANEARWDVAIIDLGLPDVDGCEVARRLRKLTNGASRRLVALTGYSDGATRAEARAAGFDDFLVKPVFPEKLAAALVPEG